MNIHRPSGALEAIGITSEEEAVYFALLDRPGTSLPELRTLFSNLSSRDVTRVVSSLEARGLLSRLAGKPLRYVAAPARVAIEVLVLRQQEALERARLAASQLDERQRRGFGRRYRELDELVEVIVGQDAVGQRLLQLLHSARAEVIGFDRPPYTTNPSKDGAAHGVRGPLELAQLELVSKGGSARFVYDPVGLTSDRLEHIHRLAAAGAGARSADVPLKMMIADERLGVVMLVREGATISDTALLLHPSPMLSALVSLFARVWNDSSDLWGGDTGSSLSPRDQRLLALLAAGHKDENIARQLNLTRRTVQRRVGELMELLGAHSRFQAGLLAGQRGWLGSSASASHKR